MWDHVTGHSAYFVIGLECMAGGIRVACALNRYHACGYTTAARPRIGVLSTLTGHPRDLLLSDSAWSARRSQRP